MLLELVVSKKIDDLQSNVFLHLMCDDIPHTCKIVSDYNKQKT